MNNLVSDIMDSRCLDMTVPLFPFSLPLANDAT